MVDIEKLTSIANTGKYPNLCSITDVEAVKSIMEIYPDLFSSTYSQGVHINRSESKTTEYGFRFQIPTGITQYQYCLLYTSPSPRDKRQSRMPSSA